MGDLSEDDVMRPSNASDQLLVTNLRELMQEHTKTNKGDVIRTMMVVAQYLGACCIMAAPDQRDIVLDSMGKNACLGLENKIKANRKN